MAKDKVLKPTKKQQKELNELMKDITNLSKNVVKDYNDNPSEMSGSITQVHENSPLLNDKKA